jgi:predicted RecA/RadA family phage recombinase
MANNYVGKGDVMLHTAAEDLSAGEAVLIGDILGIALVDIASGATGSCAVEGVWSVPKLSTDTFAEGQILYWDDGNSRLTETASTHKRVGICWETAGNPSSTCKIKLQPMGVDTDT